MKGHDVYYIVQWFDPDGEITQQQRYDSLWSAMVMFHQLQQWSDHEELCVYQVTETLIAGGEESD